MQRERADQGRTSPSNRNRLACWTLQAVAVGLLEDHLRHCVAQAARDGDADAKVKEATAAIARLVKS